LHRSSPAAAESPIVVGGGDVAVWFGELDEPHTDGQLRGACGRAHELGWLAHEHDRRDRSHRAWRRRAVWAM